jgi:putative flippase GtrA
MSAQGHREPAPFGHFAAELPRIARFCAVGLLNTALTLVSYVVLVTLGCPAPLASAAGFGLGAVNGYCCNARWTFAAMDRARGAPARYGGVQALGAGLSALGLAAVRGLGAARLPAEIVTLPWVTATTYVLSRLLVFRDPRD